jgi:antibiotic biosynthesis monooxygenase (ABM) superfamily enzyme
MTSTDRGPEPVTVIAARAVTGGHEDEFRQWARRLTAAAEGFPGFLGWGLLRPKPGDAVRHVVYRFDSPEHLATWEASALRADLLAHGAAFMETLAIHRLDGLDAWFTPTPGLGHRRGGRRS